MLVLVLLMIFLLSLLFNLVNVSMKLKKSYNNTAVCSIPTIVLLLYLGIGVYIHTSCSRHTYNESMYVMYVLRSCIISLWY